MKVSITSLVEDAEVHEQRAMDIANILLYDKETYNDVNIETLLRAAEIAGLIRE